MVIKYNIYLFFYGIKNNILILLLMKKILKKVHKKTKQIIKKLISRIQKKKNF